MALLRGSVVAAVVFASLTYSKAGHAQGVVGEKGSLTATLAQDFGFADTLVETGGAEFPNVYVNTPITTLSVEYVPVNRLAVTAALPLVGVKYDAEKSGADFDPHGPYDDGSYHFTLQDLRVDARYMVLGSPYAVAFNLGATVPVGDYPVQGSAAPGRHLLQGRLGVATSIAPSFLPNAFLNLAYELTLSEKYDQSADTEEFSQTRSDVSLSTGYFVRDDLGLFLLSGFRANHDGVNFVDFAMLTPDQQTYHDPILKEMALLLGAGVMYQINEKFYVTATYTHFVMGRNTLNTSFLGASVGWNIF